jgi:hypothetical protein
MTNVKILESNREKYPSRKHLRLTKVLKSLFLPLPLYA